MTARGWWPVDRVRPSLWQVGLLDGDTEPTWLGPFSRATAERLFDQLGQALGPLGVKDGVTVIMQPIGRRGTNLPPL